MLYTRLFTATLVLFLTLLSAACGDDDSASASHNATIEGTWHDGYCETFTIARTFFVKSGTYGSYSWNWSGTIESFNYDQKIMVIRYTNAGTLTPDIIGRYNVISWKNLILSGQQATMEHSEAYDSNMTNATGSFIGWASAADAIKNATFVTFTVTTNTNYGR